MLNLSKELENAKTIGISGHIRPDGDCIGSTMALYLYIKKTKPNCRVRIFLEEPADIFNCIKDIENIEDATNCTDEFDVFFAIDCGKERLGASEKLFDAAKCTINIDHHVSNPGTGDYNYIVSDASSASELVYDLINRDELDKDIAMALYIGIIHDTGVLQYSNTSPKTLETVARLISYGFDFPKLIEETFYEKTFAQSRIMADVLSKSELLLDGKVAVGRVTNDIIKEYNATSKDFDGIVNQLKNIRGVYVAIFVYELPTGEQKVSLRSNGVVDVSKITKELGGGGHVRASGVTLACSYEEAVNTLVKKIEASLI